MEFVQQVVVLIHLVGFASLFGGFVVQVRVVQPEVNSAMLNGVLAMLVTGIALVVFAELGPDPVNHLQLAVKLVVTVLLGVLIVANRRFTEIPRGLWAIIGLGTLVNAALSVLWH